MRELLIAIVLPAALLCRAQEAAPRPVPVNAEALSADDSFVTNKEDQRIAFMAADGQKRVWAAFKGVGARLALLEKDHWKVIPLPDFTSTLRICGMERLADGSIACLWRDEATQHEHLISRHTLQENEPLRVFTQELKEPRLLALKDGALLITQRGNVMVRLERPKNIAAIIQLKDDFFLPAKKDAKSNSPGQSEEFAPIHAMEHLDGTLLIWSPAMHENNLRRIRGVVAWKVTVRMGTRLSIKNVPEDALISVVAPWKDRQVAIAVAGKGLQSQDLKTGDTIFYEGADELNYIERIFTAGGRLHLITTPRPTEREFVKSEVFERSFVLKETRYYSPSERSSALLVFDGDKLPCLTWKLDGEPSFGWWDRPVLHTNDGFWLGNSDGAVLMVTRGKPRQHEAFSIRRLVPVGQNQMAALDEQGNTFILPLLPPAKVTAKRVEWLKTGSRLVGDSEGRVWGRLPDGFFYCWENEAWKQHEVPPKVTALKSGSFSGDNHGLMWLIPPNYEGSTAVFDPASNHWETFSSLELALEKCLAAGGQIRCRMTIGIPPLASTGDPRRIGYLDAAGVLHHFDGQKWGRWSLDEILENDPRVTGRPRFSPQNRLQIGINNRQWEFHENGRWKSVGDSTEAYSSYQASGKPPADCPITDVEYFVYDRNGICWFADRQLKLWKYFCGCLVPVFQPGEPLPPRAEQMSIHEAHVDNHGNAFLCADYEWGAGSYLLVRQRIPPPESKIRILNSSANTVQLEAGEAKWHVWRMDGGKWSKAESQRQWNITGLSPGKHLLEVLALNDDLVPAAQTARLQLEIHSVDDSELQSLISALGGDDLNASEQAARRLREQGSQIAPILREKRAKASERVRWWIDAILQHLDTPSTRP